MNFTIFLDSRVMLVVIEELPDEKPTMNEIQRQSVAQSIVLADLLHDIPLMRKCVHHPRP